MVNCFEVEEISGEIVLLVSWLIMIIFNKHAVVLIAITLIFNIASSVTVLLMR